MSARLLAVTAACVSVAGLIAPHVVLRTADQPQGPWGLPKTLVTTAAMPGGIDGSYIHPWSKGPDLYFTLSRWSDYSVALMKTTLTK
ncbi:hypothetical protein AWB99_17960 [Mycolicibacterium confluentis]|nr:hypothetical protein AWB99_17960 [Mycolicibacterium confluentis]